ncbi:MAG: hypothetical protein CML24_11675 [Rhizobiales bacterium]|nr:hypothetical protein [Hyphomicrobiales bacterium]|tara:strand:- start:4920 stop:5198 length:279 start_codon:yes stop_codon:yes gene_type:complete
MSIPRYIRTAIESWLEWRRLCQWKRENRIDVLNTRITIKSKRKQSTERERSRLSEIVHSDLAASLGIDWHPPVKHDARAACTAKLRSELHHG